MDPIKKTKNVQPVIELVNTKRLRKIMASDFPARIEEVV